MASDVWEVVLVGQEKVLSGQEGPILTVVQP